MDAGPVRATDDRIAEAVALARDGKRLLDEGRAAEALALLERSCALNPHAKVRFLQATALVETGDGDAALRILGEIDGDPALGDYAAMLPALRARAERFRETPLAVDVAGGQHVQVLVDGVVVGPAPYQGAVPAGGHLVSVRGEGCADPAERIDATPGRPIALAFRCDGAFGRLTIRCAEPAARVFVDGALAGRTPLPLPVTVSAGAHTLRLEKDGFLSLERIVQVGDGETHVLEVELVAGHPGDASARGGTTWAWVTLGTGVALTVTGGGFLIRDAIDRSTAHGETATHEADRVRPTNAIIGGVSAGVGVALVVTSFFLWPDDGGEGALSVTPLAGGATVGYGFAF